MDVTREVVLEALGRVVTRGITLPALADDLGLKKQQYARLRELLEGLTEEGVVSTVGGGGWSLAPTGRRGDRKAARPEKIKKAEPAVPPPSQVIKPRIPWGTSTSPNRRPEPATAQPEPVARRPEPAARRYQPPERRPEPAAPLPPVPADKKSDTVRPTGRITVHPAGYGFVVLPDSADVFVPAKYRGESLDGDQVVLETWLGYKGTEGRVVEVVARGRARLTGTLTRGGRSVYLIPDDPRIAADYGQVALEGQTTGQPGEAVVVEITQYPTAEVRQLAGRVIKVLGDPEDPRTEIEKIIATGGMPVEFPPEAIAQALATSQELRVDDRVDRIDLRDRRFCTIDPETARDFDDALCIEDGPHGGPRVWIAVADVSHYVRWDDALDREAVIRGVSVYLPDRVISMLPHELSAGICSLNPEVDRCAMVVRIDFQDDGSIVDTSYAAAVIRSHARLDYPGVAAALQGDFRGRREIYRPWIGELTRLDKLGKVLRAQRKARGALELDIPEAKVILDADDPRLVRDVVRSKANPEVKGAYELVESFMIAANEAVGRFFRSRGAPSVWRVHAAPLRERVETLAELLGAYGIAVDVDEAVTPLGMKSVLERVMETPASRSLSFLVLRSLKQAVWDTVPVGHFGLASGDYLHFTSPIRRYPDLLVHRLLKYHLHREGNASGGGYSAPPPLVDRLGELAMLSSGHERRAMEAEREAVAMYRAYLVREQIGEQFTGTVSAVTSFGAFVEIDEPFVEGLIKKDTLGDDVGFDEVHMTLRSRRTGLTLTLGDAVTVKIVDVSVTRRRIELALVDGGVRRNVGKTERTHGKHDIATADDYAAPSNERVGLGRRRQAGRAVAATMERVVEKGAPRRSKGGLKVSHHKAKPAGKAKGKGGGKPKRR